MSRKRGSLYDLALSSSAFIAAFSPHTVSQLPAEIAYDLTLVGLEVLDEILDYPTRWRFGITDRRTRLHLRATPPIFRRYEVDAGGNLVPCEEAAALILRNSRLLFELRADVLAALKNRAEYSEAAAAFCGSQCKSHR